VAHPAAPPNYGNFPARARSGKNGGGGKAYENLTDCIDDINPATGQPKFASYAEYEDAKDEWLIEEALRRFDALHPARKEQK
jgi:hypothetical protein